MEKLKGIMKKNKLLWLDFGIPLLILSLTTILFRVFDLDIAIQRHFYSGSGGWIFKNSPPWKLLYDYGNIPALLLSVSALLLLTVSFFRKSLIKYRKIFLFMILVMALGPGLIINSILKDNWGRPRPRDIVEFDGNYQYEKILEIDPSSKGKSFPCGHASMGFYLMTLYFVFRQRYALTAHRSLYLGILLGCLIGFARMVQGGHFASDVIWAGALTYLMAAGIFYFLKMDRSLLILQEDKPLPLKRNLIVFILILAAIALSLLIVMADSQELEKTYFFDPDTTLSRIEINIERGDVELIDGDSVRIDIDYVAHGFPWSKLKTKVKHNNGVISLKQRESGYFSEVNQTVTITLPDGLSYDVSIKIIEGNLILADFFGRNEIESDLRNGRVMR